MPPPVWITVPLSQSDKAAGEEDRLVHDVAVVREPQVRQPLEQERQRDAQLEPGERRADAEVNALAEGKVLADVLPARVVVVGVAEVGLVPVGGAVVHHHARADRKGHAADLHCSGGLSEEALRRRLEAEDLLDRAGHELDGLRAELVDPSGLGEQEREPVPDRARDGDVTGNDEVERHADDDLQRQRGVDLRRDGQQRAGEVVARRRLALAQRVHEVALQGDDVPRHGELLLERGARLVEAKPVVAPAVQALEVASGKPSMSPMTRSGSGQAKRSTTSARPSAAKPSSSAAAIAAIRNSIPATRRGVNARVIRPRIRVCSGGSVSTITGISGQPWRAPPRPRTAARPRGAQCVGRGATSRGP